MRKRAWPIALLIVIAWQWVLAVLVLTLPPLFPSVDVQVVEAFPDAARDIDRVPQAEGAEIHHLRERFVGVRTDTWTAMKGQETVSVPHVVVVDGPVSSQFYKPVSYGVSRVGWPFYAFRMTERMGEQRGWLLLRAAPIARIVVPLHVEPVGFIANVAIWLAALLVIWWGVRQYRAAVSDASRSDPGDGAAMRAGAESPAAIPNTGMSTAATAGDRPVS